MMYGDGKSDRPIVPTKSANKDGGGGQRGYGGPYTGTKVETPETAKGPPTDASDAVTPTAERVEGRGLTKGNPREQTRPGHSAGTARPVRLRGYVKQRDGIGRCGSPRCCTTSTNRRGSARRTSASSGTPHPEWTG